jgi:hypothetical protein
LQIITHTVIKNVRCIGCALDQLIGRLSTRTERSNNGNACDKRDTFHAVPPNNACTPFLALRANNVPERRKRQYENKRGRMSREAEYSSADHLLLRNRIRPPPTHPSIAFAQ